MQGESGGGIRTRILAVQSRAAYRWLTPEQMDRGEGVEPTTAGVRGQGSTS